jgi:hypothetical protein
LDSGQIQCGGGRRYTLSLPSDGPVMCRAGSSSASGVADGLGVAGTRQTMGAAKAGTRETGIHGNTQEYMGKEQAGRTQGRGKCTTTAPPGRARVCVYADMHSGELLAEYEAYERQVAS